MTNPDILDAEGPNIWDACATGDVRAVECYARSGRDLNCRDPTGCTPLHVAAEAGFSDVVRAMVAAGADARGSVV